MHTLTREARGVEEARSGEPTPRGSLGPTSAHCWLLMKLNPIKFWHCAGAASISIN